MNKYYIRKYAEKGDWPILETRSGRKRKAGDNWGDADCPFCDKHILSEGEVFYIGDKCWNCGAEIVDIVTYP